MRIPVSHDTTWYYINQFGLNTLPMTSPRRNNFLYVHNTRIRSTESIEQFLYPKYDLTQEEKNTPWNELNEYAISYRFRQLPPGARSELINILPEYSPEFLPLMNMSLRRNFEELGLSQGAISLISGVDPASGALLANSYDEIAHEEYSLDYRNTYRIQNGNVRLPLAFFASYSAENPPGYRSIPGSALGNVVFKQGHCVTGIYQSDYRSKVIIKYKAMKEDGDAADIFDYVICAIPFSSLRTVEIKPYFADVLMQAILELNYIDAMKALFLCNRRFWERNAEYGRMLGGISFTDLPIQSIIYPGDHNVCVQTPPAIKNVSSASISHFMREAYCSSEEPGVLTASYNLTQNSVRVAGLEEQPRYDLIRQNVEEVHGLPRGFLNSFVEQQKIVHWNSEPYFRGALAYTLPGQKPLFAYAMQQPEYHGRVYFAGEHVSNKHGWMQGALSSGKAAANRLAEQFHNQY
jgi:monoamine oxidase